MMADMKYLLGGLLALALLAGFYFKWPYIVSTVDLTINGPKTISDRVAQYGNNVSARLGPDFAKAGIAYPPSGIILVVLKRERRLELYAQNAGSDFRFIHSYPILAESGHLGP